VEDGAGTEGPAPRPATPELTAERSAHEIDFRTELRTNLGSVLLCPLAILFSDCSQNVFSLDRIASYLLGKFGGGEWTRTTDLRIMRPSL
jgi:hypothetical protein